MCIIKVTLTGDPGSPRTVVRQNTPVGSGPALSDRPYGRDNPGHVFEDPAEVGRLVTDLLGRDDVETIEVSTV
jgi:hypothetical protein